MKTSMVRMLLGGAVVAVGVLGGATAAQAVPTGCTVKSGLPGDAAEARCTSGTGEVRVVVECTIFPPGRDPISNLRYGPWVGVGATSRQSCPGGPIVTDAFHEVR